MARSLPSYRPKGQVILPKAVREQRNWPAGTRLTVENTAEGVLLRPAPVSARSSVAALFGVLAYDGPAKTIEGSDIFLARTVMLESEWVLRSAYGLRLPE